MTPEEIAAMKAENEKTKKEAADLKSELEKLKAALRVAGFQFFIGKLGMRGDDQILRFRDFG